MRTTPGLPRPWICQTLMAAPSSAVRHASYASTDEFAEQLLGTQHSPSRRGDGSKKQSSLVIRKVDSRHPGTWKPSMVKRAPPVPLAKPLPLEVRRVEANPVLAIKHRSVRHVGNTEPWKTPSHTWPNKPMSVFSCQGALNLRRLPFATTTKDIVMSIVNAVREGKVDMKWTRIADIAVRPSSGCPDEADAAVEFVSRNGAQAFHDLAIQGQFKVRDVVPEVFLNHPRVSRTEASQPSKRAAIAPLSKQDRAE